MNPFSLRQIRETLQTRGIYPQKRWGQNFLINRGAGKKIVGILNPESGERIWEIGPGLGALTELLVEYPLELTLFEIDRRVVQYVESHYGALSNVRIVQGDVIKTWKKEAHICGEPDKILGNLPYNSASAIIGSFFEEGLLPVKMVFTVQRELAARMTSRPGVKDYSAFSIMCQSTYNIVARGNLNPGSFFPEPSVISTIVELTPRQDLLPSDRRRLFRILVRASFESRRKTLRNNLLHSGRLAGFDRNRILTAVMELGINPGARAEELTIEDFSRITEAVHRLIM